MRAGQIAGSRTSVVAGAIAERPAAMTDNQRRYLFRLLAGEGYEGTAASMRLCDAAGVESLRDITKAKASSLIDEWQSGGEQTNGR